MDSKNNYRLKKKNQFDGNLIYGAKKFHSHTQRICDDFPEEYKLIIDDTKKDRYRIKDKKNWENLDRCFICGSTNFEHFINRFGMDYYRCKKCTHRFLSPRLKEEKAGELYAKEKSMTNVYAQDMQSEVDKIKYEYGLNLIEEFLINKKENILDIGCGNGHFVNVASKNGWNSAIGVDINPSFYDLPYDSNGIQFINCEFRNLDLKKLNLNFETITLWDVLEHIYNPIKMLKEIHSVMNENGILLVMVPNVNSLASRIIRDKSPTFTWGHVSSFSEKSLRYLLSENGFQCLLLETVITEIDNIKSYLSGENPYSGYGDPDNLFGFITPEYIHDNLLGSRLLGIFKKI